MEGGGGVRGRVWADLPVLEFQDPAAASQKTSGGEREQENKRGGSLQSPDGGELRGEMALDGEEERGRCERSGGGVTERSRDP